eukprot:gene999-1965_t
MALTTYSKRTREEKVVLEWSDIKYNVFVRDPTKSTPFHTAYKVKHILKNVNGHAESGQLLAIMGPTGCGKTSLVNILAARVSNAGSSLSTLNGIIKVNGSVRNEENFRRISAYVLQDDLMYAHLTVKETLQLAANFYLSSEVSETDKKKLVENVMAELGLAKVADTIIGNDKVRGVSGGERKRAAIATQLIADPAVLFLDEPTSGLDSFQAQSVMECMKSLATAGRLVISVIHQPRSSIFNMFDRLILLSEGYTVYYGVASNAVEYFSRYGYSCPDSFNPADHFLDVLSPDNRNEELDKESSNRILQLAKHWENENEIMKMSENSREISTEAIRLVGDSEFSISRELRKFSLLCWRTWNEVSRNIFAFELKMFFSIFFALIIGGIYSSTGNNQKSIQNRIGLLYFVCINQVFNSLLGALNTFPKEKIIVNRELSSRAYNTAVYFFAKFLVELPSALLPSFVFAVIIYWISGLNPQGSRFVIFFLILNLITVTAMTLGLAISAFFPTVEAATAAGPVFVVIGIVFGGFYININSLPIVANWIPYISLFYWSFQALCINEFEGVTFTCDGNQLSACIRTGEDVLNRLSFTDSIGISIMGCIVLLVIYFLGALLLLINGKTTYISIGFQGASALKIMAKSTEATASHQQQVQVKAVVPGGNDVGVGSSVAGVAAEDGVVRPMSTAPQSARAGETYGI